MKANRKPQFSAKNFLANVGVTMRYEPGEVIFAQADPADNVFHIQKGKVKLTVLSNRGKQAVIGILCAGEFFGEGCLAGQPVRTSSAAALEPCSLVRFEKPDAVTLLQNEPAFAERFLQHLLSRNIRIEEDLVDQLFNSCEKRLARVLLLLANFGKEDKAEPAVTKISQETLAEIIGTTRSRVSFFMNRFRKLGFIEYKNGLEVHSSLLEVLGRD